MKRQLPIVDISRTAFYVDVVHDCLRQQGNAANTISFDVFEQERDGYTFLYDREMLNAAIGGGVDDADGRYVQITLPALMELDPEGIAIKYNIPLEVLCPEMVLTRLDEEDEEFYNDELF